MASSAKHFSLFLVLITFLSSLQTHARDSLFFNKIPTTTDAAAAAAAATTTAVPDTKQPLNNQREEPNFLPANENSYGLYGHDSRQLPPSATTSTPSTTTAAAATQPLHNYLPKNYNPVAYVTEPEDINESTTFTEENSFTSKPENNNDNNNYYNQEEESRYRNTIHSNNYRYNGGSSFNTGFNGGATYKGGGLRPQGMSDTRFMENGKYFYDVDTERYSSNHPYESLRGNRARNEYYNSKNFYGNSENAYEFNSEKSMGGYQNQDEFQDEENNLP